MKAKCVALILQSLFGLIHMLDFSAEKKGPEPIN